jgi:hypothetical protein
VCLLAQGKRGWGPEVIITGQPQNCAGEAMPNLAGKMKVSVVYVWSCELATACTS